jgi:hypothetical protein
MKDNENSPSSAALISWAFRAKIEQTLCIKVDQHHSKSNFRVRRTEIAKAVTIRENSVILLEERLDGVRVNCYVLSCHYGNVVECCWSDQRLERLK